jgi:cytochrome c oxidase subunit 1
MSKSEMLHFPDRRSLQLTGGLSRWWLLMGVLALAIPGLFAVVLVAGRSSDALAALPVFEDMFTKALVVHVDLLVLVWFLSMACMLWSIAVSHTKSWFPLLEEAALICVALATLFITASAFDPSGEAHKSNYIPVIMSPLFFIGLSLFLCGITLMLCRLLTVTGAHPWFAKTEEFALFSAGLIGLIAITAFFWSYDQMPAEIDGEQYYDIAFWGGGHILQFIHTQMVMVCWLIMARAIKADFHLPEKLLYALYGIGLLSAFSAPVAYLLYEVHSSEHRQFFTNQMIYFGGIAPAIIGLLLLPMIWKTRVARHENQRAIWSALLMSIILFLYGGVLGGMIEGQNVVIPAHYHGSIVGITLGFMGAAYLLLPFFGYKDMSGTKLAFWQPIIFGLGQMMHSLGLAWLGGYGVARKTPGGLADAELSMQIATHIMRWGGLLAVIGGVMFMVVIWKAVRGARQ